MEKGVSIIICCYNSTSRLKPTLEHIAKQEVSKNIPWEIILVDNNSDDETSKYAAQIWEDLDCNIPFHIIIEQQSGLSFAREKGINKSIYKYILFCDDDNWLDSNYVQVAMNLLSSKPNLAIIGGYCRAVSNIQLPQCFNSNQSFYAVGEQESKNRVYKDIAFVHGAGMILNKSIYLEAQQNGFRSLLTGRNKKNLSSGEDTEICFALKILGFDIHYTNELSLQHFIPEDRLNMNYLINLRKGILRSDVILSAYKDTLLNKNRSSFYFLLLIIHFLIRLPIFFYRYLTSNKLIAIVGFYHYYYRIRYYKDYIDTRNSIQKWKKNIQTVFQS